MQTSYFEIFDIAAKLRIADYLKDGAKSVEQLAEGTET
jgi:hypothetical protein